MLIPLYIFNFFIYWHPGLYFSKLYNQKTFKTKTMVGEGRREVRVRPQTEPCVGCGDKIVEQGQAGVGT